MTNQAALLSIVLVPIFGSILLPLIGRLSLRVRNYLALALVLYSLVLTITLGSAVVNGGTVTAETCFGYSFGLVLHADGLAVFMAFVSALISAIIVFYSWGYISHYRKSE